MPHLSELVFLVLSGAAVAADPTQLTDQQLDRITAGAASPTPQFGVATANTAGAGGVLNGSPDRGVVTAAINTGMGVGAGTITAEQVPKVNDGWRRGADDRGD